MQRDRPVLLALSICLLLGFVAGPALALPVDPTAQARAQARYEKGVEAYRAERFDSAIEHFLAADRLVPSPALAFNVARAYEKLDEEARALQYYRLYLQRGPDPSNEAQVRVRVQELETWLAGRGEQQLTVRSNPEGASLSIDGKTVGPTPWTGELKLGRHRAVLADGRRTRHLEFDLLPDAAMDIRVSLPAETTQHTKAHEATSTADATGALRSDSETSGHSLPAFVPWLVAGAGAAALSGAALYELRRRDAEQDARSEQFQPAYHEHRERMLSNQKTARVFAGVGALLVASSAVLVIIRASDDEQEPAHAVPVAIACDGSACVGSWKGRF